MDALEVELELEVPELVEVESDLVDAPSDDFSEGFAEESESADLEPPLAEAVEARESVMYQPLPLKTIPTGWITLRSVPPHCSQVVRGGSVKLWRFSIMSLQAVQV